MKFRTLNIIRLMTWAISTYLKGKKNLFIQGSDKLQKLGGIYIKFLQIVVINLDPDQSDYRKLLSVFEHREPDELNIWEYLKRELPRQKLIQIKGIEPRPFATGSFGQVYHAELVGGQRVIIKILRPSVEKYLHYDLRLLGLLSRIYNLVDRQNIINYRSMFKHFRQTCLEETDYLREAAVADYYYQAYKDHPHLTIPRTYKELSNRRVFVQDFIAGTSLTQLLEMQSGGTNVHQYTQQNLGTDLIQQLIVVGTELLGKAAIGDIMHADPHPGNILVLPGNRVALIDFGMSTQLSENRYAFYKMLVQYGEFYSGNLAIDEFGLSALHFLEPELYEALVRADRLMGIDDSQETIMDKLRLVVTDIFEEKASQPIVRQFLARKMIMKVLFFAINKGNRFGFSFDLKAINLIKAAQNYLVMVSRFDNDAFVAGNVVKGAVSIAEANLERLADTKQLEADPGRTLETLSIWIDKMARHDPWLMHQLTERYIK